MGCCQGEAEKRHDLSLVGKEKASVEEEYDVKYVSPEQRKDKDVRNT